MFLEDVSVTVVKIVGTDLHVCSYLHNSASCEAKEWFCLWYR